MSLLDTLQSPAIIPATGDGNTFQMFNEADFPSIYISGTLAANNLIAEGSQGLLTLTEYSKFLRDMQLKKTKPLIADLQSGFGNPLNTYYSAQELERSGADIMILNDQPYPAHSTAEPQSTTIEDILGKTKAAKDALEDGSTELWIMLEGIKNYGFHELQDRMKFLSRAGADAFIIAHANESELNAIAKQPPGLPILATYDPEIGILDDFPAWLDTGFITRQTQAMQANTIQNFAIEGAPEYAKK